MINVDEIFNGFVLDHIQAGRSMAIYHYLNLDELDCQVAIIKNARSGKMGRKDIIKVEGPLDIVDFDILGFIDHNITVDIIKDGKLIEKRELKLPKKIVNVLHCKNPRCITSIEQELEHMPSVENFQTVADIFKQLGDGSRIRIFWLLCHCEECVINLSAMINMSSPAVSHHLKQLKSAGLIVNRRDGKEVYYKAADTEQARNFHHMIEWLVKIACPSQVEKQKGTP